MYPYVPKQGGDGRLSEAHNTGIEIKVLVIPTRSNSLVSFTAVVHARKSLSHILGPFAGCSIEVLQY